MTKTDSRRSLFGRLLKSYKRRLVSRIVMLSVPVFAIAFAADYIMQQGDTLIGLSQSHYGDSSYWQALQSYNGIGNVYTIPIGTPINFPDKAVLDQVKTVLADSSLSDAQKTAAIVQLGGSAPAGVTPNAGLGKPINYNALGALGQRTLPSL